VRGLAGGWGCERLAWPLVVSAGGIDVFLRQLELMETTEDLIRMERTNINHMEIKKDLIGRLLV